MCAGASKSCRPQLGIGLPSHLVRSACGLLLKNLAHCCPWAGRGRVVVTLPCLPSEHRCECRPCPASQLCLPASWPAGLPAAGATFAPSLSRLSFRTPQIWTFCASGSGRLRFLVHVRTIDRRKRAFFRATGGAFSLHSGRAMAR